MFEWQIFLKSNYFVQSLLKIFLHVQYVADYTQGTLSALRMQNDNVLRTMLIASTL